MGSSVRMAPHDAKVVQKSEIDGWPRLPAEDHSDTSTVTPAQGLATTTFSAKGTLWADMPELTPSLGGGARGTGRSSALWSKLVLLMTLGSAAGDEAAVLTPSESSTGTRLGFNTLTLSWSSRMAAQSVSLLNDRSRRKGKSEMECIEGTEKECRPRAASTIHCSKIIFCAAGLLSCEARTPSMYSRNLSKETGWPVGSKPLRKMSRYFDRTCSRSMPRPLCTISILTFNCTSSDSSRTPFEFKSCTRNNVSIISSNVPMEASAADECSLRFL
mmetsp:Transcript_1821/g.3930  ORF Transcript_1821/g.3930 Transcript_1821/m.3930 type:complete len:273 (+) Transcript_1821:186-1004(+)